MEVFHHINKIKPYGHAPFPPLKDIVIESTERYCQLVETKPNKLEIVPGLLISRRRSPAAMFQMIDFSRADSSLLEVNAAPLERDYGPDCEPQGISVPDRVT